MYNLPETTRVKRQLSKNAIYTKFNLKPSQQKSLDADISRIDIVSEISKETIPALNEGVEIKRCYVLDVQLKTKDYDIKNIVILTKLIPQKLILALHFDNQIQFAIYYNQLITSPWKASESATLSIEGLNVDSVWTNFVKTIGNIKIESGNTLSQQITIDTQRAKLCSKISALENKMRKEKQPRRKREYFDQIKQVKLMFNDKSKLLRLGEK